MVKSRCVRKTLWQVWSEMKISAIVNIIDSTTINVNTVWRLNLFLVLSSRLLTEIVVINLQVYLQHIYILIIVWYRKTQCSKNAASVISGKVFFKKCNWEVVQLKNGTLWILRFVASLHSLCLVLEIGSPLNKLDVT
jgi:hypothetical protein